MEWKKIKSATGDVRAKSGYHTGNRRIIRDMTNFIKFIEANCQKACNNDPLNGLKCIQN